MVYLQNPPQYSELEETLAWEKTFNAEKEQRRAKKGFTYSLQRTPKLLINRLLKRDKLVRYLTRYCSPGAVLDVGCAGGHMLARLPTAYIPNGIEISRALSLRARELFEPRGGRVVQADAIQGLLQFSAGEFTGIIMTSYLEHESDPKTALLGAARVMKPNARLIVKVPNYASWNRSLRGSKWCGYRFPDHVNYFTPETLERLLRESGLRIVQFGLADRMPTSDNMWLVAALDPAA